MVRSRHGGRLRSAVPILLLIMILLRLVWMQLRLYPAQVDGRALISLETWIGLPGGGRCDASHTSYRTVLSSQPMVALGPLSHSSSGLRPRPSAVQAWVASPGYVALAYLACQLGGLEDRWAVKLNQWLLVMAVLCAALMTRMITSSWTVALASATVVLSRGRLLADIGLLTPDYVVMLCLTFGLMAATHMLRTGARISFVAMAAAFLAGALFEPVLMVMFWLVPALLLCGLLARGVLTRPIIGHLRGTNRQLRALNRFKALEAEVIDQSSDASAGEAGGPFMRLTYAMRGVLGLEFPERPVASWRLNYDRGSLFRTISLPFMLWAYWQRRWLRLTAAWLGAGLLAMLVVTAAHALLGGAEFVRHILQAKAWSLPWAHAPLPWFEALIASCDLHLLISLGILLLCLPQAPAAGLPAFFEWSWLLVLAILLLTVAAFAADTIDAQLVQSLATWGRHSPALQHLVPRRVLLWLEPTILSCGVAGIYNLMKVLDTRVAGR